MKKLGFTMAELIVALGIVGVVAALTAPAIANLMPDKNKIEVLKLNKVVAEITDDLLKDSSLYYQDSTGSFASCIGLNCMQQPLRAPYNTSDYRGINKYPNLLAKHLKLAGDVTIDSGIAKFETSDGISWVVKYSSIPIMPLLGGPPVYGTITVDLNGASKGNNCLYSSSCTKPDKFSFSLDLEGRVSGLDALTKAYLANPEKLNDKNADLKTAAATVKLGRSSFNYDDLNKYGSIIDSTTPLEKFDIEKAGQLESVGTKYQFNLSQ